MPPGRSTPPGWRHDSILAQAREPLFLLGPDRRILLVNRAWEELTGHAEAEVIGLECRPHGPTRAGDLAGLGGSFCPPPEALGGRPAGGRTTIIRRGGERVDRRVEFWPLHGQAGTLGAILGFVLPADAAPRAADAASQELRHALLDIRARLFARHAHDALIGVGPEHRRVLDGVEAAASSSVPVTIVGEPGTGKRFVARQIHARGPRRQMPLLGYDCRAVPPEILERELFAGPGGALDITASDRLLAPDGSTVVVGDLLDLPRDLQARLASALASPARGARLIATTAGDLDAAVHREQLRPDLYLAVTPLVIRLRPLRDRLDDLPSLAQSLLERANLRGEVTRSGFEPATVDLLSAYDWPGNLRELAEVVEAAHAAASGELIAAADLPARILGRRGGAYLPAGGPAVAAAPPTLKERLVAFERRAIEEALALSRGNKTRAASRLGVNRPFLYRRMRELRIADAEAAEPGGPPGAGEFNAGGGPVGPPDGPS